MIDIGGHSLIRAAAKNYLKSTIIVDPLNYQDFIKFSRDCVRQKNMQLSMKHITKYDISITKWFEGIEDKEYSLRYGENPQQKATAFINKNMFKQLSGEKTQLQ